MKNTKIFFLFFLFFNLRTNILAFNYEIKSFDNIYVDSNNVSFIRNNNEIIFTDKVILKQRKNNLIFNADKIMVKYTINNHNKIIISSMRAIGNVKVKKNDIVILGDKATYNLSTGIINLNNNIVLYDNLSKIYGDQVIYNVGSGEIKINSLADSINTRIIKDKDIDNEKNNQVIIFLEDSDKAKEIYGK